MLRWSERALGLLLGALLDALFADPPRRHPVAAFGACAAALERRMWADSRAWGGVFTVLCVSTVALVGRAAERVGAASFGGRAAVTAGATWAVLGGASLGREAAAVAWNLLEGNVLAARTRLPALCGRDPQHLDCPELSRAAVESLAENTSDAVVAPLLWGAVAGVPGLLTYRAVNTLDAMVGHRSPRYERFGWAAARLDDAANFIPARVTGLLTAVVAPVISANAGGALRTMLRDGADHPSPNGGRCEAAYAGALGVRLGGTNVYDGRRETRGPLGDGTGPTPADVLRAVRLSYLVDVAAVALAVALAHAGHRAGPR
jgi:adenosylcobinamide-phosphate synthase